MLLIARLTDFSSLPDPPWKKFVQGQGTLKSTNASLQLINTDTSVNQYTNAQLDDYQGRPRRDFLWRPPLRLEVCARFSHSDGILGGTAGFGFWNDPFMMTGFRWPTLPRAVWFFYSSPLSNMKLDLHTPGYGWKVATIDAWHWPFFALAPLAPIAVPLMNISALYRICWPLGQRAIKVSEAHIEASMTSWHTYTLVWHPDFATFKVDDELVLDCQTPPQGPLGFVLWFDNQYMVVTPWGQLKYGLIATQGTQWMEVSHLSITHTASDENS